MITDSIASDPIYKDSLPSDFLHGYSSASYQIEGGYQQDGRGLSNWDVYLKDRDNGNDAVDSYNRWKEDVRLLKQYGCNVYRFSISWSRVKPLGGKDDPVNEKGIQYYSDLIDALLEAGIEPFVTIYHWDLPLKLQERYNGFSTLDSSLIVQDFAAYSKLLFERFGDRVRDWITINEPHAVTIMSSTGLVPDWSMKTSPWIMSKNLLLCHANTVDLYRREFQAQQGGQIGITLDCDWFEPIDDSPEAKTCAEQGVAYFLGWFADPVYKGHLNPLLKEQIGDNYPDFSPDEWKLVKGSSDFFGLNHYGTRWTTGLKYDTQAKLRDDATLQDKFEFFCGNIEVTPRGKDGTMIGNEGNLAQVYDVPWGFRKVLQHVYKEYAKPSGIKIYVTENGFTITGETKMTTAERVNDVQRQTYFNGYIKQLINAVREDGMPVAGYMGWSLLDNLEWGRGWSQTFGVTYVDRDNDFERIPKDTTRLLKQVWEHVVARDT